MTFGIAAHPHSRLIWDDFPTQTTHENGKNPTHMMRGQGGGSAVSGVRCVFAQNLGAKTEVAA